MKKLRGVILDVDGTLVDSNDAHTEAWTQALREHGYERPFDEVRRLIGMGGDNLLSEISELDDKSGVGKQIVERRGEIFRTKYLPGIKAFPQVRALVERMQAAGLEVAIASSAKENELDPLLERANVADLIPKRTSADDAPNSKPDPDVINAALQTLGLPPEAVVMVGDTPYDIAAATKAGVATIALRSGGWDDKALHAARAIYADPAALLADFAASPLGA